MKRLMVMHGLKRSGNHAVINWIRAHDRFLFFNNIIPIAPILRGQQPIPPTEDFAGWLQRQELPRRLPFSVFPKKMWLRRRTVLVSLEDHEVHVKPFRNIPCALTNVLIVRDPDNLFASRIRKASMVNNPAYPKQAGPAMDRVRDLWKKHAREYLGLTAHLEHKVGIYFNAWFADQGYRRRLSQRLDLAFTDRGFSQVSAIGGGSSFDGTAFDNNNRMMKVLDRTSQLTDAERQLLENTLDDSEVRDLAHRIAERTSWSEAPAPDGRR